MRSQEQYWRERDTTKRGKRGNRQGYETGEGEQGTRGKGVEKENTKWTGMVGCGEGMLKSCKTKRKEKEKLQRMNGIHGKNKSGESGERKFKRKKENYSN